MPGPPLVDYVTTAHTSLILPAGSTAGSSLTYDAAALAQPSFQGGVDYPLDTMHDVMLGYLSEIWQQSANKGVGISTGGVVHQAGIAEITSPGDPIARVDLQLFSRASSPRMYGTHNGPRKWGYAYFIYPNGYGDLIKIGFDFVTLIPHL